MTRQSLPPCVMAGTHSSSCYNSPGIIQKWLLCHCLDGYCIAPCPTHPRGSRCWYGPTPKALLESYCSRFGSTTLITAADEVDDATPGQNAGAVAAAESLGAPPEYKTALEDIDAPDGPASATTTATSVLGCLTGSCSLPLEGCSGERGGAGGRGGLSFLAIPPPCHNLIILLPPTPLSPTPLPPPPIPPLSTGRCDDTEVAEQQAALNLLHSLKALDASLLRRQCRLPPPSSSSPSEEEANVDKPEGPVVSTASGVAVKVEILDECNVLLGKVQDGVMAKVHYSLWAEASEQPQGGGVVSEQPEGGVSSEQLGGGSNGLPGVPGVGCGEGVLLGEGILSFLVRNVPFLYECVAECFPQCCQ